MIKTMTAACAAVLIGGSAALAAPLTATVDAYIASNFNTSTGAQSPNFVDLLSPAGSLTLTYDSDNIIAGFAIADAATLLLTVGGTLETFSYLSAPDAILFASVQTNSQDPGFLVGADLFVPLSFGLTAEPLATDISLVGLTTGISPFVLDTNGRLAGINLEIQTVNPVPLPASLPLLGAGMALMIALARKKHL